MFKMKFTAALLCVTTVFATFSGAVFAKGGVIEEETIVIENGKVVSGNSELIDNGMIVLVESEEDLPKDESSEPSSEEETAEDAFEEEELSEEAKLQFILDNIGGFFKPVPTQSNAAENGNENGSAPTETPNAVNPSVPAETTTASDFTIPAISHKITAQYNNGSFSKYNYWNGSRNTEWHDTYNSNYITQRPIKTNTAVLFGTVHEQHRQYVVTSGQTLEFIHNTNTAYKDNYVGFSSRGDLPTNNYNFHIIGGTMRIVSETTGTGYFIIDAYNDSAKNTAPIFRVDNYGTLEIKNAVIRDNYYTTATGQGSAINVSNGNLHLEDVTFIDCRAEGTTTSTTAGGTIFVSGKCTITLKNCEIKKSYAGTGGAIAIADGTTSDSNYVLQMENTTITDCYTNYQPTDTQVRVKGGGGIYLGNNLGKKVSMKGCTFQNTRSSYSTTAGANGGAVFIATGNTVEMDKVLIKECYSGYAESEDKGLPAGGGGIYSYNSTLKMRNCNINWCYSRNGDGGGIFVDGGTLEMLGCRLDGNQIRDTVQTGSAYQYTNSATGNTVKLCSPLKTGAAIYVQNATVDLVNTTITNSQKNADRVARGAVYITRQGKVTLAQDSSINTGNCVGATHGTTISQQSAAISNNLGGGGVYIYSAGEFVMNSGNMAGNQNVYKNYTAGVSNNGYANGVAVMMQVDAEDSTKGGTFRMYGGTVSGHTNQTSGNGGAIGTVGKGNVYIYGGTISDNTATNGGGIYVDPGCDLYIEGGEIKNNIASTSGRGGGVYANAPSHFFVGNSSGSKPVISGNHGSGSTTANIVDGGGIYVVNAGIYIYDAEISGNYAKHGAGIYATYNGTPGNLELTILKCDISNNKNGSGIWLTGSVFTLTMTGGTISGNTIADSGHDFGGAGICATNSVTVNISGSKATPTFISNNVIEAATYTAGTDTDTALNGGGIACISRGSTQAAYGKTLTIEGNVTISGNKVPFGGDPKETVTSGKGCGGGVFMEEGGTVIIREKDGYKPAFNNNEAYRGGAVYVEGYSGYTTSLQINGATFTGNVSNEYRCVLSNGNSSNPHSLGGGALCVYKNVSFSLANSEFTSNKASMESGVGGGAVSLIDLSSSVTISGCKFDKNYVGAINAAYTANASITGDGGAIFCRNITTLNLTGCTITNNKSQQGGALYVIRDSYNESNTAANTTVTLSGCTIESNTDGAVFVQRNSDNNYATSRNITLNVGTTTIKDNTTGNYGSHRFGGAGITAVNGITVNLNSGTKLLSNINNVEYIATTPEGISNIEEVDTAAHGGGIALVKKTIADWCKTGTLTVNGGVEITGNKANYGNGGGIYLEEGGVVDVFGTSNSRVIISNNESGGTIDTPGAEAEYDKWQNNGGGGGIYLNDVTGTGANGAVTVQYADITGNKANGIKADGGGINAIECSLILNNCLIQGNKTTDSTEGGSNGGGVDFETGSNSTLTVTDCKFIDNSTYNWGGGLNIAAEKTVTITGTVFDGNYSDKQGGGLHLYNGPTVTMSDSYFGNNKSGGVGGGILLISDKYTSSLEISNCCIGKLPDENGNIVDAGNSSVNQGGGIYVAGDASKAYLTLGEGIDISNNVAGMAGGGIYFAPNSVFPEFNGVVIENNHSDTKGGGVYASNTKYSTDDDKDLEFSNCEVNRNSAGDSGGGIYAKNIKVTVNNYGSNTYGVYSGNTAGADGGAIKIVKDDTTPVSDDMAMFKISGNIFINGSAGGNGGAISIEGAPGYIVNSYIYGNTAGGNGGGIHYVGNNVAEDSILQIAIVSVGANKDASGTQIDTDKRGNKATGLGGGLYVANCKNFVSVRGGYIYNNALRGGGVYVLNCEKAIFTGSTDEFKYTAAGVAEGNGTVSISANTTYRSADGTEGMNTSLDGNGAGLYAESNVALTNVLMQYNSARFDGGGICVGNNHTVTLNGINNINNNVSYHYGGGIIVLGGGTMVVEGNTAGTNKTRIYQNRLITDGCGGAGVHVANGASFTMSYGEISDNGKVLENQALVDAGKGSGGGIDITGGTATLNYVNVINNVAGASGGGVRVKNYLDTGSFTAVGCVIKGNKAANGNGGGIYVAESGATATADGCYVVGNVAGGTMAENATTMAAVNAVSGVGGGVAVFDGGKFEQKNGGAIYDNQASVGGADVFSNGSDTKLKILAPEAMNVGGASVNGVDIPAFVREGNTAGLWWEDYKNNDTKYTEGLYGDIPPALRYASSPVSIRAYTSSAEGTQSKGNYINTDGEFVSIVFEIQKYNVGTITITAPESDVENQRFVFEITGVTDKGEPVNISVSLESGKSVTIADVYPGVYQITQKTDWSWRCEIDGVAVDGGSKQDGVVTVTVDVEGVSKAENHTVVYTNDDTNFNWLSHNSPVKVNVPNGTSVAFFDMAEAKKTYVL